MIKKIYYRILSYIFVITIVGVLLLNKSIFGIAKSYCEGVPILDIFSGLEENIADCFYKKDLLVSINGLVHKASAQRYMNEVVLLDNGHGTVIMNDCDDEVLKLNADRLKIFSDFCIDSGATFTFAQVPYKNEPENSRLPRGLIDYSNSIADRFGIYVVDNGIDYLDLRNALLSGSDDFYSYFNKTDHHWNCYGGFLGFTYLVNHFSNEFGDVVDGSVLNLDNYNHDIFQNVNSGYYGTRVGTIFLRPEDYYVLYPNFDTKQTCIIPHKEIIRTGNFYDAVLDKEYLFNTSIHGMYGTYIGGDYPLVIHESKTAKTDKTVLLFIDSYGTIPESFLTTVYKKVVAVDLRWVIRNGWTETAVDYVQEYNPDHVVVMLNPNQLIYEQNDQFEFGTK